MGKMRLGVSALALASMLFGAACAKAETITATLGGYSEFIGQTVSFTLQGKPYSGLAGLIPWQDQTTRKPFSTFCIEITEDVYFGNTYTFDLVGPTVVGSSWTAMSDQAAATLAKLFAVDYDYTSPIPKDNKYVGSQADRAAAFQLAVWQIVYGTDFSFSSNAMATSFLSDATNYVGAPVTLTALRSAGYQDQIIDPPSVPLPAALWGGLALLGGLGVFRFRTGRHESM